MPDNNQQLVVSTDLLRFYKALQDAENLKKFVTKEDAKAFTGAVRYDGVQVLTPEQKAQARANIGVNENGGSSGETVEGAVRYDVQQALDEDDKARARENIGAGTGTWADMPDKPFGKTGWEYVWDGNTEGLEVFSVAGGAINFYKVSSDFVEKNEIIGADYDIYFDSETTTDTIDENTIISEGTNGSYVVLFDGQSPLVFVAKNAGTETIMGMEVEVFSAGVWLPYFSEEEFTRYIRKISEIKKIDKEFLPDDINIELPEGLVTTDENGLIPASMLPSYVDDVIEGIYIQPLNSEGYFATQVDEGYPALIPPESGKIYVDINTGNTYRWSGTQYVQLNPKEFRWATNEDIEALFI